MPTLALFTACERSIIEAETKSVSLINLFTGIKAAIPADELPPSNAVVPKEWAIVVGWDGTDGDHEKEFVQHLAIFFPDGKPFAENQSKFKVQLNRRHYNTASLLGFPVGQAGKCHVQVWAEFDGKPVTDKISTYIEVEHESSAKPK